MALLGATDGATLMTQTTLPSPAQPSVGALLDRTAALLGGAKLLKSAPQSPVEIHHLLVNGLPKASLNHMIRHVKVLRLADIHHAIGISVRTGQRARGATAAQERKPLTKEQSGRTWEFAEVLAAATEVFGSQEAAETWMQRPAMGLNHERPIDLLATPAGTAMVKNFLTRLEYGVYT
ncbi:type II RES/Xre toxin-antitoxin system antitoxin [Roseomonas populi]|uniref:DUF2384 domain-containing protein n=1 Tax=Roseomonas populi TaxID=3121582 RepID=A0ABT1X386_9PROT|nr:antitoxin Xre/MbcA/ParS toxin-binding domain-containing protein [Roseomonas pecuniae]MCR0982542.1 DUF2384 domain-containing protein [Roseomonas pecuniae]